MANGFPSSTLQLSHLKKFIIQNMIYKVTLAHLYFYYFFGKKNFIDDNAAVYADVSIFHQYLLMAEEKLVSSVCLSSGLEVAMAFKIFWERRNMITPKDILYPWKVYSL